MFRVQNLRWLLIPTVLVGLSMFAGVSSANAQGFSLQIGSPIGFGSGFQSFGYAPRPHIGYGYGAVPRYGTGYRGYVVPGYGYSHGYRSHRPSYRSNYYPPVVVPYYGRPSYGRGYYPNYYGRH